MALTLVSAEFTAGHAWLVLTFDRAIDLSACDPSQITVDDQPGERKLVAVLPTPQGADGVLFATEEIDSSSGPDVLLTASDLTGIVAVDDGGTWAGVTDLELPFG